MSSHLIITGSKSNNQAPNGVGSIGNKNHNNKVIQSKQNDSKTINNVENGTTKTKDDEDDEEKDCLSKLDMNNCCQNLIARSCTKKQLNRKLPITDWLPKYNVEYFVSDLIAGITVGLTVIPQGIAYALIAELPPQVSCFRYM